MSRHLRAAPLVRATMFSVLLGLTACSALPSPSAPPGVVPTGGGVAGTPAAPGSCHAGDGGFLPDPACTPGEADSRVTPTNIADTVCRSGYTKTVRPPTSVTEPLKRQVMAAYGLAGTPLKDVELDHELPLELGGASTVANLWPEPWAETRGAHHKDQLENVLHSQVCAGRMELATAQRAITSNWEAAYRSYVGPLP